MSNVINFPERFEHRPIPGETLSDYCERTGIPYSADNEEFFDNLFKRWTFAEEPLDPYHPRSTK